MFYGKVCRQVLSTLNVHLGCAFVRFLHGTVVLKGAEVKVGTHVVLLSTFDEEIRLIAHHCVCL